MNSIPPARAGAGSGAPCVKKPKKLLLPDWLSVSLSMRISCTPGCSPAILTVAGPGDTSVWNGLPSTLTRKKSPCVSTRAMTSVPRKRAST